MIYRDILREILYSPYTLFVNLRFFNIKEAIRFPIVCMCPIKIISAKGRFELNCKPSFGMIRFGTETASFYNRGSIRIKNDGIITFGGRINFTDRVFISCDSVGEITFGERGSFVVDNKIICASRIYFGKKVRSSWNCTYIDTDFHPLIDIVRKKTLKQSAPIIVGDGCWIGHDSIVSKGTKLAKNTTVASGSVVKGKFKTENCIIGGNIAYVLDEGYVRDDCYDN